MAIDELDDFDYPSVIEDVISEFSDSVSAVFHNDKVGILLIGSASRGELCWDHIDGEIVVFSDIEFIVAVENLSKYQIRELADKVSTIESRYRLGSRFHIDHVVMEWSKLKSVEKRILIFDSKKSGVDLTVNSVSAHLPDVTLDNLNFKELNDVLLHRMKAILLDFSEDVLLDKGSEREYILSIAKNSLDITTWLFPYEAKELATGFGNRIKIWKTSKGLELSRFIDDDYVFLQKCLYIRSHPAGVYELNDLLVSYVSIYRKAIEYCCYINGVKDCDISTNENSRMIFFEYSLRRRLKEAYLLVKNYKVFGIAKVISNMFMPRKGKQVDFCYEMITSLTAYMDGTNTDRESLERSWEKLQLLRRVDKESYPGFLEEWFAIRSFYKEVNEIFI